jgi:hypothetical protein
MNGQPEFSKALADTSVDFIQWPWAQSVYDPSGVAQSVPYLIIGYHDIEPPSEWPSCPYDISGMRAIGLDFVYANPPRYEYVEPMDVSVQVSSDGKNWSTLDVTIDPFVSDGDTGHIDIKTTSRYLRVVAHPGGSTIYMDINLTVTITEGET